MDIVIDIMVYIYIYIYKVLYSQPYIITTTQQLYYCIQTLQSYFCDG